MAFAATEAPFVCDVAGEARTGADDGLSGAAGATRARFERARYCVRVQAQVTGSLVKPLGGQRLHVLTAGGAGTGGFARRGQTVVGLAVSVTISGAPSYRFVIEKVVE